ncbi:MAG: hypothetical protein RLW87_21185 [Alphaproteobacteria bacterium]
MGIGPGFFQRLLDLRQLGNLGEIRAVAEIGNQQLSHGLENNPTLNAFLTVFGADGIDPFAEGSREGAQIHGSLHHQEQDQPNSRIVWHAIGAEYTGFDMDDDPDTVALDLNFDSVPERHRGRYDLVSNLGTTEHVLNQFNAFKAAHDLCRPGGIMIHELPGGGYANHGFFNYNPKFFWQLAKANKYRLLDLSAGAGASYRLFESLAGSQLRSPLPWTLRDINGHDVGLSVILAKPHDEPFRAPLDVGDFGEDPGSSDKMRESYPSYFGSPEFWSEKPVYGPPFRPIFDHLPDYALIHAIARRLDSACEAEILSLRVASEPGETQAGLIGRYLDQVNAALNAAYRRQEPAPVTNAEIDLSTDDFVGLEWGKAFTNAQGMRWRQLGPRGHAAVLQSLAGGVDYDVTFQVVDMRCAPPARLVIQCGDQALETTLSSSDGGVALQAVLPAACVERDGGFVRIGLTVLVPSDGSPSMDGVTEISAHTASVSSLAIRPLS